MWKHPLYMEIRENKLFMEILFLSYSPLNLGRVPDMSQMTRWPSLAIGSHSTRYWLGAGSAFDLDREICSHEHSKP
jgi:hypothetical protein